MKWDEEKKEYKTFLKANKKPYTQSQFFFGRFFNLLYLTLALIFCYCCCWRWFVQCVKMARRGKGNYSKKAGSGSYVHRSHSNIQMHGWESAFYECRIFFTIGSISLGWNLKGNEYPRTRYFVRVCLFVIFSIKHRIVAYVYYTYVCEWVKLNSTLRVYMLLLPPSSKCLFVHVHKQK